MRPTHVVLVGECVQRFAERSPSLTAAVKEHGPLPLPGLVRHCFRNTDPCDTNTMIDSAFGALRMMQSVEGWVTSNNELYQGLSESLTGGQDGLRELIRLQCHVRDGMRSTMTRAVM